MAISWTPIALRGALDIFGSAGDGDDLRAAVAFARDVLAIAERLNGDTSIGRAGVRAGTREIVVQDRYLLTFMAKGADAIILQIWPIDGDHAAA